MTFQQSLQPLYTPYAKAGRTIAEFAIATYDALTSDRAKAIYAIIRDRAQEIGTILWVVAQLAFWFSILAGLYTIQAGRQFRAYYQTEWADTVNWILTYPDRCLETEDLSVTPVVLDDVATVEATVQVGQTEALALVPVVTEVIVSETAINSDIPEAIQAILDSDRTKTAKLRAIATHFDIRWRNARGQGRHMLNAEIQTALNDHPAILATL